MPLGSGATVSVGSSQVVREDPYFMPHFFWGARLYFHPAVGAKEWRLGVSYGRSQTADVIGPLRDYNGDGISEDLTR